MAFPKDEYPDDSISQSKSRPEKKHAPTLKVISGGKTTDPSD